MLKVTRWMVLALGLAILQSSFGCGDRPEPTAQQPQHAEVEPEASDAQAPAAPEPEAQAQPQRAEPSSFEVKLAEAQELAQRGQTRSALILVRMMQQEFAGHERLNELIALERTLNEQRELEVDLAVPLRNLGADQEQTVRAARQMLRRSGDRAVPLLRRLTREDGGKAGREAALLLADLGDDQAIPLLIARLDGVNDGPIITAMSLLLADADPGKVKTVYQAFEQSPTDALAEVLIAVLLRDADRDIERFNTRVGSAQGFATLQGYVEERRTIGIDGGQWAMRHSASVVLTVPGLRGRFYEGTEHNRLLVERLVDRPHLARDGFPHRRQQQISARWTGRIRIDTPGRYTFAPTADDGQRIIINGKMVVDDWRMQSPTEATGTIELSAGEHDFEAQWMQGGGGYEFTLRWEGPGIDKQVIPAEVFSVVPWEGMER